MPFLCNDGALMTRERLVGTEKKGIKGELNLKIKKVLEATLADAVSS